MLCNVKCPSKPESPMGPCLNPLLKFGKCETFCASWSKIQNKIPPQPSGNAYPKLPPVPYAITPMPAPPLPYEPRPISITRPPWEGWRYGANWQRTDEIERPYGFPDYHYYRGNYCGPCCPCVAGTNPPLLGDPNGQNPNIRYVQLDFKSLLGSGFACQGPPPVRQTNPFPYQTSCGKDHCTECSGVYKKTPQPTKFQVCIGDPALPLTCQPNPVQETKVYLPMSVLPRCPPDGDKNRGGGDGDCGGENQNKEGEASCKQLYEVFVPGQEYAYNQQGTEVIIEKGPFDPCGSCNACCRPKRGCC